MANNELYFLVRGKDETAIYSSPEEPKKHLSIIEGECGRVEISGDGSLVCGVQKELVNVFHVPTATTKFSIELKEVLNVGFSNRGNYLVICQRPDKQVKAEHKNIQVWEIASGECVWSLHRQNVNDDAWPILQWSPDESSVFLSVVNTIHVYSPRDNFKSVIKKLPVKGISTFSVSPGRNLKVATYTPESKSTPASILIYPFSGFPKRHEDSPVITNRKSFYRVSGVYFLWNNLGNALLCSSFSDVDVTNQSYYGEQHLHFFDGESDLSLMVPNLPKGPIHDVQWTPQGDYFAVVAGFMPAKTVLYDVKCKPVFDLGSGAFNFIRFNPFGRFLCVAGFGNLPGDIVFFEKKQNGVCKKLNCIRSPSVSLEWSPSGRQVLTAITAPRLRVDNRFKLFDYYGEELSSKEFPVLFEVRWMPVMEGSFVDRPISPTKRTSMPSKIKEEEKAYVPPHLRGKDGQRSISTVSLSLGHSEDSGGRIRQDANSSGVPGGNFLSKAAAKNAKRRAKKRGGSKPAEEDNPQQQEVKVEEPIKMEITPKEETEKKIRTLRKKVKQIEQLKQKVKSGNQLEPEQMEKLKTENEILNELRTQEAQLQSLQ